jgi:hypothetical protein
MIRKSPVISGALARAIFHSISAKDGKSAASSEAFNIPMSEWDARKTLAGVPTLE